MANTGEEDPIRSASALQLRIARYFVDRFLDGTAGLFGRSFNTIFIHGVLLGAGFQ
jgi:hypothetical protein